MKFIYSIAVGLLSVFSHTSPLHAMPAMHESCPHLSLMEGKNALSFSDCSFMRALALNPGDDAPPAPPPPAAPPPPHTRPGLPLSTMAAELGPLADLAGTWVGNGFNLISLPDFSSQPPSTGPQDFRLKLNATVEILQFTPIGGSIPNRGVVTASGSTTGQPDIDLFGLTYLQRISDLVTNEALHIEPGIWLNVPATTVFPDNPNPAVVRLATIPHGNAVLAQSTLILNVPSPIFTPVSSTPFRVDGSAFSPNYLDPFLNPPLPPGIKLSYVANPNQLLQDATAGQNIINTVVLVISTNNSSSIPIGGGILNIPFLTLNANATQFDAIFWIETVQQSDGSTFLQLQYTQTVMLNFLGINWPHISVATLIKQ